MELALPQARVFQSHLNGGFIRVNADSTIGDCFLAHDLCDAFDVHVCLLDATDRRSQLRLTKTYRNAQTINDTTSDVSTVM
jgi:hypothetical protein